MLQILRDRGYVIKERGVIQVKGKGEMLTSYVLGRKISRRDELLENRSSRKTDSQEEKRSSWNHILLKILSENQFSGKTYFYTISSSWHFGRTVSSGNNSLAEVVYGMVRARKRRTGRRGRLMGDPCGGVACILQGGPFGWGQPFVGVETRVVKELRFSTLWGVPSVMIFCWMWFLKIPPAGGPIL